MHHYQVWPINLNYIALYEKEKLNADDDQLSRDEVLEDVFLSPATIRRHVVDIVS